MQSFNIENINYDANTKFLTFQFSENETRCCSGFQTVSRIMEEIEKTIRELADVSDDEDK